MSMNAESLENLKVSCIQLNHTLVSVTIVATTPRVRAVNVTPSEIQTRSFLKYCNIKLLYKSSIHNFYDNLATQAVDFHIFLRPLDEVTKLQGVDLDGVLPA